ncbi:MAG: hypothetical protein ACRCYP_03530 [Alphaproteobacteria bacterium]
MSLRIAKVFGEWVMLSEVHPTFSAIALYTPSPMPDGFVPAPVFLSEVEIYAGGRCFAITENTSKAHVFQAWDVASSAFKRLQLSCSIMLLSHHENPKV